jgi:hypothetical protein
METKQTHTPGICQDCSVYFDGPLSTEIKDGRGIKLCSLHAAVSEILVALKALANVVGEKGMDKVVLSQLVMRARAAIAKAERGEEK